MFLKIIGQELTRGLVVQILFSSDPEPVCCIHFIILFIENISF